MNISLHRCEKYFALCFDLTTLFFGFDVRQEVSHRLFHYARAFNHLRQKHFAAAEEVANLVHAIHERAFDDMNRTLGVQSRLLGVFLDKFGNAFNQRIG